MSRVLITVLGTSEYKDTYYTYNGEQIRTRFIQQALVEMVYKDWHKDKGDKIIVLLTDEAYEENYKDSDKQENLESILRKYPLHIKKRSIKTGRTEEELWEIFQVLMDCVKPNDRVALDITHSLRNLPMQAMIALNHASVLDEISFEQVYYGAYEVGVDHPTEKHADGKAVRIAPIFSLSMYIEIMEWSQAVHMFLQTGQAKGINKVYQKKTSAFIGAEHKAFSKLTNVVKSMEAFTKCIENNRGKLPQCKKNKQMRSIQIAAERLYRDLEVFELEGGSFKPLTQLFGKIQKKIECFIETDYVGIGMATTHWCIEYDLIVQGYITLQETMKTYMCQRLGIEQEGRFPREDIARNILKGLSMDPKEFSCREPEGWQGDYEEKFGEYQSFLRTKIELFKEAIPYLGSVYHELSEIRNDISHFGFIDEELRDYKLIKDQLVSYYEAFDKILKESKDGHGERDE